MTAISIAADKVDQQNVENNKSKSSEIAENIHIHGIREIFSAPSTWVKIVFLFIFLLTMSYTGYELYQTISVYLEEPTASTLTTYQEDKFPPVAYCPMGYVNETKASSLGLGKDHIIYIMSLLTKSPATPQIMQGKIALGASLANVKAEILELLAEKNWIMDQLIMEISYDVADIGVGFIPAIGDPDDVTVQVDKVLTTYGTCYLFTQVVTMGFLEAENAYEIAMVNQYPLAYDLDKELRFSNDVLIVGETAQTVDPKGELKLRKGHGYSIKIATTTVSRISSKHFTCSDDVNMYDYRACYAACINQGCNVIGDTTTDASCVYLIPGTEQPRNSSFCTSLDSEKACKKQEGVEEKTYACVGGCEYPCRYHMHEVYMTDLNEKDARGGTYKGVMLEMSLHNPEWSQEIEESFIYTWESLISSLGGFLGLWCGMSLLSIVQVIYFCVFKGYT